jgi:hypothetical protein
MNDNAKFLFAIVVLLFLTHLVWMLWMIHQEEREINENRRFYDECRREILKVACMLLQSDAGNLGKLTQTDEKCAHLDHDSRVVFGVRPASGCQLGHVSNPIFRFFTKFFFGVHKIKNVAKQPAKVSSTPPVVQK